MGFLIIDSSKRINGTSTEFTYKIIKSCHIKNEIKLIYAHILNTEYLINDINDKIYINFPP